MNTITINLHSTFFNLVPLTKIHWFLVELNTEVGAEDLMQLLKNYSRQQGTQMKAPKIDGEIWELVAGDVCFFG